MKRILIIIFLFSTFIIDAQEIIDSSFGHIAFDLPLTIRPVSTGFQIDFVLLSDLIDTQFKSTDMINQRIKAYQDFIIPVLIWETQCKPLFVDVPYFREKDYRVDEFIHYR